MNFLLIFLKSSQMSKDKLNMFNYKMLNNFLIFLFISVSFSIIVKLTKVHTKNISYKIHLIETPDNKIITNQSYDSINLTVSSYGFDFIKYYLSNKTINISSKNALDNSKSFIVTKSNSSVQINDFISPQFELKSINFDSLFFNYDKLKTKNIPVILNSSIDFSQGFDYFKNFNLTPDSVSIVGPEFILESIKSIKTKKLNLTNLKTNTTQDVELNLLDNSNLLYSNKSVKVFIEVEKSTESILDIPVSIINIPNEVNINYYPKLIKISFTVSLDNYQNYSAQDFKIICDFNQISQDGKLTPKVLNKPIYIKNLRLINNEIQYVFLK